VTAGSSVPKAQLVDAIVIPNPDQPLVDAKGIFGRCSSAFE
jgi:hypothetical protein